MILCYPIGRLPLPHKRNARVDYMGHIGGCSSVVEHRTFNPLVVGSNPTALTRGVSKQRRQTVATGRIVCQLLTDYASDVPTGRLCVLWQPAYVYTAVRHPESFPQHTAFGVGIGAWRAG